MVSSTEVKPNYTSNEMMVYRAALELRDHDITFVGIGLPNLACNLAREMHAPHLFMIYEAGAVGAVPERLPISIGDPALVTGSLSIVSQAEIFQNFLQRGFIQVGFLGGAQIDRWGNLNSTVIGDYKNPKVRLPGSGGACEIATHAKRLLIVMKMNPKAFVEKCDFITSPGHNYNGKTRKQFGMPGAGPEKVITDLGVLSFDPNIENGEAVLTEVYAGVTVEQVKAQCGWPLKVSQNLNIAKAPTEKIVATLQQLDPKKLYL